MDAREFTEALLRLERDDIESIAVSIETHFATAEGEVFWWQAHLAIHEALKNQGALRAAGSAAHQAADAVLRAATRAGLELPSELVTRVAREAQEVVRGLVAGSSVAPSMSYLLENWVPVMADEAVSFPLR
jgi:hypothetical protein